MPVFKIAPEVKRSQKPCLYFDPKGSVQAAIKINKTSSFNSTAVDKLYVDDLSIFTVR